MIIRSVVIIAVYSIVIFLGSFFVQKICEKLDLPKEHKGGLLGAGKYIGYFERFIVLTLLLIQQYEAIAFIFAGKSISRFSKQEEIEYYLVGTFASLSWAIFWGLMLRWLLGMLTSY